MPHRVLRHHERGLIHDVEVGPALLHHEIAQLDRGDGVALHAQAEGVGEVAVVGVLFAGYCGFNVGFGQVVGHEDLDARNLVELAVGVGTGTEPQALLFECQTVASSVEVLSLSRCLCAVRIC